MKISNENELNNIAPFPLEIFPEVVRKYIKSCEESLNLVADFMGVGVLSAVASMIGNSYQIKIREGWTERPILWIAVVGYSGVRKTPSLKMIIDPLQKIDKRLYQNYCKEKEQYDIEKEAGNRPKPIPKQLIVGDTTIEALLPILKNNPNGILYYRDELIGWINDLTRYSKGSAEQHWLSLYSNEPIRLNRKTTEDHLRIDHPFANILGGIQPDVLSKLFEEDRATNGFTNRILFSYPPTVKRTISTKELDSSLMDDYDNFINRFFYMDKNPEENKSIDPIILPFSRKAQQLFYEWNESFINSKINDKELPEIIKSVVSKLEAIMPRLALIIQFIDDLGVQKKEPTQVDVKATQKAIILVNYFCANFFKVQAKIQPKGTNQNKREIELLRTFSQLLIKGESKKNAIHQLINDGFGNNEIARALNTSKTNVSYWKNQ